MPPTFILQAAGTDFTETRFDGAGRMIKTIAPDLSEPLYTPIGSELTITDPANRKTKQKKDAFGRLTSVTEYPGGTLRFVAGLRRPFGGARIWPG